MKIGLVCPYSINKGGGVLEIVRALQKRLLAKGHDAYIITPEPQGEEVTAQPKVILIGSSIDFNSPLGTTGQVSAGINESIDAMLEREQFDLLHFHEPWVPMLSLQLLSRSNTINVATFHAKLPETMVSRTVARVITPYTRSVLKYIHEFTAVSPAAADYLCSLTDRDVAIIPNGIDLSVYTPPAKRSEHRLRKTVLYVGRLEPRKGVKYLLRAFKLLSEQRPDVSLILAGDGVDRRKLEELADYLELKNVKFLGYVSEKEKIKLLRSADVFCSPALHGESFGVVLLEALGTGLVTVAGDNPGYAAVMNGLGSISLVNPKHVAEFARRLDLMLYQSELRALWRTWAAGHIKQFDWDHVVEQYEEMYKIALKKHKK